MTSELFNKGLEVRKAVLGKEYVEKSIAGADDFAMAMQEYATEACWGKIWTRPGLPRKTRSLLNIAMITVLNRPHELKLHIKSAFTNGDSEQTRRFYEDFLGLRLAGTLEIGETKSGRKTATLHTFYELGDGSYLAFFEAPDMPFEFKPQHDFDLHIALEVDNDVLERMFAKGKSGGIETRGITDHGFIRSIYFRDPNGYVIELTAKLPNHDQAMDPATNGARAKLDQWQAAKQPEPVRA